MRARAAAATTASSEVSTRPSLAQRDKSKGRSTEYDWQGALNTFISGCRDSIALRRVLCYLRNWHFFAGWDVLSTSP